MAYISQSDLEAHIPPQFIVEALDDDRDGVADSGLWEKLAAAVDRAINSRLAPRFSVPFAAPVPDLVAEAALVFAGEMVFRRRGVADEANPWAEQAGAMRTRLERIGRGDEELTAGTTAARPGGAIIGERARVYDKAGRLMV